MEWEKQEKVNDTMKGKLEEGLTMRDHQKKTEQILKWIKYLEIPMDQTRAQKTNKNK